MKNKIITIDFDDEASVVDYYAYEDASAVYAELDQMTAEERAEHDIVSYALICWQEQLDGENGFWYIEDSFIDYSQEKAFDEFLETLEDPEDE